MERFERSHRKIENPEDLNGLNTVELAKIAERTDIIAIQEALSTHESELIRAALLRNVNLAAQIRAQLLESRQ